VSHYPHRYGAVAALLIALTVSGLFAQGPIDLDPIATESQPDKKEPRLFRRPKQASPAEQFEYAQSLDVSGKHRKARRQYRALVHQWHDSPEAAKAQRRYAELLLENSDHEKAFDEFQYLVEYFAGEFPLEPILEEQYRIANYVRTHRPKRFFFLRGSASPKRSLPLYELIVRNGPNWDRSREAQFYVGVIHENEKEYELAIAAYETLSLKYSLSAFVASARFRRGHCLYKLSQRSPRDEERCEKALTALLHFELDYPQDPNAPEAAAYAAEMKERLSRFYFDRADFYDRIANRPRSAIIEYNDFIRHFPTSEKRDWIDQRIATLELQLNEHDRQ